MARKGMRFKKTLKKPKSNTSSNFPTITQPMIAQPPIITQAKSTLETPDFNDSEFLKFVGEKKFEERYGELKATQNSAIDFLKNVITPSQSTMMNLAKIGGKVGMFAYARYKNKDNNLWYKLARDGMIGAMALQTGNVLNTAASLVSIGCSLSGY